MKLNGFNAIAPYYDQLASFIFGKSIANAQTHFLKLVPANAKVLVLGGGTGWWLKHLQQDNPHCEIWFIDASSEMLSGAVKNSVGTLTPIHGTDENIPSIQFDVVITYFFLDMFEGEEIKRVISRIKAALKPEGIWLISDFVNTKFWHRIVLLLMYRFFKFTCGIHSSKLVDWEKNVEDMKLTCADQVFFYGKFIASCVYRQDS